MDIPTLFFRTKVWKWLRAHMSPHVRGSLGARYLRFRREMRRVRILFSAPVYMRNWWVAILDLLPIRRELSIVLRNSLHVKLRTHTYDMFILREVFYERAHDAGFLCLAEDRPLTVVDAGTHIGTFALLTASRFPHARIYCLEPIVENYELALTNVADNGYRDRISLENQALSDQAGDISMFIHKDHTGGHSAILESGTSVSVHATTLEDLFRRFGITSCDLLKLDIEGSEFPVLFNATKEVVQKVRSMVMEYHPFVANYTVHDLGKHLQSLGFDTYVNSISRHVFAYQKRLFEHEISSIENRLTALHYMRL